MGLIIRPMEQGVWAEMLEIYYQGIQTNMATFENECPTSEEWDKTHTVDCRLVAEDDCEVVGFAVLSPVSTREVFKGVVELHIYVDVDHKRMGVGEMLLNAIVEESDKSGYWAVMANVLEENVAALGLFEKCGFRRVGKLERTGKDRFGVWRSLVIYEHRIQSDIAGGCDCDLVKNGGAEPGSVFYEENK